MEKKNDGLKALQEKYRQKQAEKVEIIPVEHSQAYHEKVKKYKTPPPSGGEE
jgi:hypothetical protein